MRIETRLQEVPLRRVARPQTGALSTKSSEALRKEVTYTCQQETDAVDIRTPFLLSTVNTDLRGTCAAKTPNLPPSPVGPLTVPGLILPKSRLGQTWAYELYTPSQHLQRKLPPRVQSLTAKYFALLRTLLQACHVSSTDELACSASRFRFALNATTPGSLTCRRESFGIEVPMAPFSRGRSRTSATSSMLK